MYGAYDRFKICNLIKGQVNIDIQGINISMPCVLLNLLFKSVSI